MAHKVKIENISECERKLSVEVPYAEIEQEMQHYYAKLARDVKLKGFRAGKVPMQVIQMRFAGEVKQKISAHVIEHSYAKALSDHKIVPVAEPHVNADPLIEGKPFTYTAVVEVKPQVTLKNYKGLSLQKEKISLKKKEIDERLEQLRESKAQLKVIETSRGVSDKDFVVMDFEGRLDGKTFPGGSAKNFLYELGSKRFVPGFEEGLLNMKPNEEKSISVKFPQDYHEKKLMGKEVIFKVNLKEIKQKSVPKLDDSLAKEFEGCKSLKELEDKVKNDLTSNHQHRIHQKLEQNMLEELVKKNVLTAPPSMVDRQYNFLMDDSRSRLQQMGLQGEKLNETMKNWQKELTEKAQFDVKVMLLLEAISEQEKLKVSDEELDQRLSDIAKQANATQAQVKKHYEEKGLLSQVRWQIRQQKTVEFLLSQADIKEN